MTASQKLRATQKFKAQTSKIVSSFKAPAVSCLSVRTYLGHKDGIWDIDASRKSLLASASLDRTACIWAVESGACLLRYAGHQGSVNCIRFHPVVHNLILTAGGDHNVHVWQAVVAMEQRSQSEEEDVDGHEGGEEDKFQVCPVLRTPSLNLASHRGPVSAADWLHTGDKILTASWDHTALLWDSNTGQLLHTLSGHDQELTYCCSHPGASQMAVTASKDTTFRLWDFREARQQVGVFQGHTDTVTCAVLTTEDKVVSGSNDRSCKIWDLRNLRSPLVAIRVDSPINRLSVSPTKIMSLPHDNRHIQLFDMQGQRLARLPHNNRIGHKRMVCATCWASENSGTQANLFSCGFDHVMIAWHVAL